MIQSMVQRKQSMILVTSVVKIGNRNLATSGVYTRGFKKDEKLEKSDYTVVGDTLAR